MDIERFVADAKELCYAVAPAELSGSPLWIVPQTKLPPLLGANTVCYGYDAKPRIITDNGPQFISRDFKEFIRIAGMTHVKTSPWQDRTLSPHD